MAGKRGWNNGVKDTVDIPAASPQVGALRLLAVARGLESRVTAHAFGMTLHRAAIYRVPLSDAQMAELHAAMLAA